MKFVSPKAKLHSIEKKKTISRHKDKYLFSIKMQFSEYKPNFEEVDKIFECFDDFQGTNLGSPDLSFAVMLKISIYHLMKDGFRTTKLRFEK